MQCADCVDCRRADDNKMCDFHTLKQADWCGGLPGELGLDCYDICPRKRMFPKCTSCCDCYHYSIRMHEYFSRPEPTPWPLIESADFPYPTRDAGANVRERNPFDKLDEGALFGIMVLFVLVVAWYLQVTGKLKQATSSRRFTVRVRSSTTGQVYVATKQGRDPKDPTPEPGTGFEHPSFKPSGNFLPKHGRLPRVRPRLPPPSRPAADEESEEAEEEPPMIGWEEMMEDDREAARAAARIPRGEDDEEEVEERPVCLLFLEGSCALGMRCQYLHEAAPVELPGLLTTGDGRGRGVRQLATSRFG